MHILELRSSNIKRISAVQISVDSGLPVITIGGENGAGKSSVIDSIVYALGGQALIPAEPIRAGETEAEVYLDLGDLVVTRKFKREKLHAITCARRDGDPAIELAPVPCNCQQTFGPTTSTLVVKNKDGAKYPTPQAILDRLFGVLSFDLQEFSNLPAAKQLEMLRTLVGLDTKPIDTARKEASDLRRDLKKQLADQTTLLRACKTYPEAPEEEISMDEIAKEVTEAERLMKAAQVAEGELLKAKNKHDTMAREQVAVANKIEALEKEVEGLKQTWRRYMSDVAIEAEVVANATEMRDTAVAAVPDAQERNRRMAEIGDINQKVRANKATAAIAKTVSKLTEAVRERDEEIEKLDEVKANLLSSIKFPVAGLGLTDDGVTFNGVPLEQASTSEKIRVKVAIGLALNPKIRVLLVRNGNALDKKSMLALTEQAREANAQVWVEYVTDDPSQVAVMIEDGHVAV